MTIIFSKQLEIEFLTSFVADEKAIIAGVFLSFCSVISFTFSICFNLEQLLHGLCKHEFLFILLGYCVLLILCTSYTVYFLYCVLIFLVSSGKSQPLFYYFILHSPFTPKTVIDRMVKYSTYLSSMSPNHSYIFLPDLLILYSGWFDQII